MSLSKRFTAACAAALLLAASAPAPAVAEPLQVTWQMQPRGLFRGNTRVVIPTYHVTFILSSQATAVGGIGARTRLTMALFGPDEAVMRRLTDEAYADLIRQFEAAGISVVSAEETRALVAAAGHEPMPGNATRGGGGPGITINRSIRRSWVTYGPQAAPALSAYRYEDSPTGMSQMAIMRNGGFNRPAGALSATVIIPALNIDFAQMSASTGSDFLGRRTASAGGQVGFTLMGSSSVVIQNPASGGRFGTPGGMRPRADVVSSTSFATVEEGGAPVRVGSMTTTVDDNYQAVARARGDAVVADVAVWEGLVRDAYRAYNAAIVAAVVQDRGGGR